MRFHIMTLFPDMVLGGLRTSVIGRAEEKGRIAIEAVNIRDYTTDKHKRVDDYTYGGGAGLLIQAQPVYDCWKALEDRIAPQSGGGRTRVIYVTPQGDVFDHRKALELSEEDDLVFLCGHYEGVDERVLEEIVTDYISIGDYVLTGGELAAMVMVDAVARLVPGVLNNDESAQTESHSNGLLEYPQYSRPEVWHDKKVPEVLLSGHHANIEKWRLDQSLERTRERRPEMYAAYMEAHPPEPVKDRKKKIRRLKIMEALKLREERFYTVEDIENMPEGVRAELIEGEIYYMASPGTRHQRLVHFFDRTIGNFIADNNGDCEVFPAPFAVYLNKDSRNYVEPDISVVCDKDKIDDKGCHGAPDWVIEIVSPGSKPMDYYKKLFKYRTAGVREYWVVDPDRNSVMVYSFEQDEMAEYQFGEDIPVGIYEGFSINVKL